MFYAYFIRRFFTITTIERTEKINIIIDSVLEDSGVMPNHKGYDYLATSLFLIHNEPTLRHRVMELYEKIAVIHGLQSDKRVNGYSVERAIRYAIQYAYDYKTNALLFFKNDYDDDWHCPTNSEFIAKAACYMRKQLHKTLYK